MAGDQPWHELPKSVADVLRPALAELADEIIEAVRTVPAYSRPLEGAFGEGVRAGVHSALEHFLAEIEAGGPVARGDVYRSLGRGEMRAGRSLDSLLSAYRVGARAAWRRFAAAGEDAGLSPSTLYLLAEALFAYIDVLSAESAAGYAVEQSAVAGEAELWRRRVIRLLVLEPPAEPEAVQAAAAAAGWALPRTLAALAIGADRGAGAIAPLRARLVPDAVFDTVDDVVCMIVPDPDAPGRRAQLKRLVARVRAPAGLGPTVGWADAATSFSRACAALELARIQAQRDHATGLLVVARERSGELLLASSPALARELATDRLSPLDGETDSSRERLTETLQAWLAEQGRLAPVARRLGVHPQTARYRIGRLRELFGSALDDPDERFWLELALRVSPAVRS
jgi:hypothetical protein